MKAALAAVVFASAMVCTAVAHAGWYANADVEHFRWAESTAPSGTEPGPIVGSGGGIKYPFWTRQDAHLTDIGFNANPHLEPKGTLSLYADVGYRFTRRWSVTGYYDSYRFDESNATQRLINPAIQGCTGVAPDPAGGCRL